MNRYTVITSVHRGEYLVAVINPEDPDKLHVVYDYRFRDFNHAQRWAGVLNRAYHEGYSQGFEEGYEEGLGHGYSNGVQGG